MQGILIVDKPMDWTSFDVVAKLRGVLGTRKLGHSGTLDPMATGVLPVFCGGASKAVDLQLNHDKSYRAVLRLGEKTDTGDVTGTVLETAPVTAGAAELLAVLPQFSRHVDLCIDHHAGNSGYADFTLLDGGAAAAAELLYEVICAMGVDITPHIADCLYTGLATDTGCFRFSSTTANTHLVAAKLIEAGCHVEELNTLLFDTKPRERMEAERIARNHLEYYLDGRCALIYLTRDEIEHSGVDPADLEELTSLPVSIEGVKVGLTLRQQPGGSYRISVRTAKGVDACAIARRLGGGGHARAAGCELLGNLENTKNAILAEVEAELDAPQEDA